MLSTDRSPALKAKDPKQGPQDESAGLQPRKQAWPGVCPLAFLWALGSDRACPGGLCPLLHPPIRPRVVEKCLPSGPLRLLPPSPSQPSSPRKPELAGCRAANPNTGRKCLFSSPNCPSCCVVAE